MDEQQLYITALQDKFGVASNIPSELQAALDGEDFRAFRNDSYLTLHFPKIFNNQDLTVVYDRIWKIFQTATATDEGTDLKIVQIPIADICLE